MVRRFGTILQVIEPLSLIHKKLRLENAKDYVQPKEDEAVIEVMVDNHISGIFLKKDLLILTPIYLN